MMKDRQRKRHVCMVTLLALKREEEPRNAGAPRSCRKERNGLPASEPPEATQHD